LKVVDGDDKDLPRDSDFGLEVSNWVSRIRSATGIDIRIISSAEGDASAAILVTMWSPRLLSSDGGHLSVRHDGQINLLTPGEALGSNRQFYENSGPPAMYCGSRVFGNSVKAFSVILGLNENDSMVGGAMFSRHIGECMAVGMGFGSPGHGSRAV